MSIKKCPITVADLIDQLERIENKELPIFVFAETDIVSIEMVDDSLTDRVDLNIKSGTFHKLLEKGMKS